MNKRLQKPESDIARAREALAMYYAKVGRKYCFQFRKVRYDPEGCFEEAASTETALQEVQERQFNQEENQAMNAEQREAIRARLNAAKLGPWSIMPGAGVGEGEFFVHAPADIEALLAEAERLGKRVVELETGRDAARDEVERLESNRTMIEYCCGEIHALGEKCRGIAAELDKACLKRVGVCQERSNRDSTTVETEDDYWCNLWHEDTRKTKAAGSWTACCYLCTHWKERCPDDVHANRG